MSLFEFTVEKQDENLRVDKFLSDKTELTRSNIVNLIELEKATVNNLLLKKNYKVKENDFIVLDIPPPCEVDILPQNIPIDIVYEDNDILVVNKCKGMVVHPAPGNYNNTLVNALLYHCKESLSGINGYLRPGIVHRIDKNTSGLLMVAKNDRAHLSLSEQIKNHSFTREYNAIICGNLSGNGSVNAPIGRCSNDRKKMCVTDKNAKSAVTHYEIISNYNKYSHLKLILETGRTHQIRVHMAFINHPIVGDDVYGNGKPEWLNGQCLHAIKLGFIHPTKREYIEFVTELPDYFNEFLKSIQ